MNKFFINILVVNISCILAANEQLLHYVSDETSGGSYKYYSLMYEGVIKIILLSQKGDADLYLSQTISKPTYEPDQYCLQSTTCGEDIIFIPESFKRPVSIGVYGHPSHETSHYNLLVYHVALSDDENFDEQSLANNLESNPLKKISKKSFFLTFLWTLLDQFIQVFCETRL
ncbi:hypothetical protein PV328_002120 [Microctonus aethiopoides]|uniref:Uncharacterized protein n=1 Tax=Microctonus aethiopoides TaxID=144406 RepID=A0AA39FYM2_9HYME|nr:hypothetical protein PV328_002120 [Microctonus aethiopoides]